MRGIGSSPGIAIGRAIVISNREPAIECRQIKNVCKEIEKLKSAIERRKEDLDCIFKKVKQEMGEEEAAIFKAHKMILEDPELIRQVEEQISKEKACAEYALKTVGDIWIQMFENMDNVYMKERAADVKDVIGNVLKYLTGMEATEVLQLNEETVIVAEDLTPSDTARMDKSKVTGILTNEGGRTSHVAIMTRTLEIPSVVGLENITEKVATGDMIVMDGENGTVFINPDENILEAYIKRQNAYTDFKKRLKGFIGKKSMTQDGKIIELVCNIGTTDDLEFVIQNDGEGIGLFRTEFLYMNRNDFPSEEEQFEAYKTAALAMKGKPVIIRTLDIGGDKELPYLTLPEEMNPFLGYRAIRLCLDQKDIFKTQLRAVLRASIYGNIKIMFPMISAIEELRQAKALLNHVKSELLDMKIKFNEDLKTGMMVEVPAAAILSDVFAKEVDFFSIGTNDLIQYITAVDRGNTQISHLYSPFHPALLRLVKRIIDNGHKAGIHVGMCGEAAGDLRMIPILAAMGIDELSMNPASILGAREILSKISMADTAKRGKCLLNLATAREVMEELEKWFAEN